MHLQLAARLGFQLADGGRDVSGEDGRVRPLRVGERGRCHVLGPRVQRRCDGVVPGSCHRSPVAGEDLVGPPAEQERVGALVDLVEKVAASLSKSGRAHPPRSNPPLRSSSGPPSPCITPSTETLRGGRQLHGRPSFLAGLVVVRCGPVRRTDHIGDPGAALIRSVCERESEEGLLRLEPLRAGTAKSDRCLRQVEQVPKHVQRKLRRAEVQQKLSGHNVLIRRTTFGVRLDRRLDAPQPPNVGERPGNRATLGSAEFAGRQASRRAGGSGRGRMPTAAAGHRQPECDDGEHESPRRRRRTR